MEYKINYGFYQKGCFLLQSSYGNKSFCFWRKDSMEDIERDADIYDVCVWRIKPAATSLEERLKRRGITIQN